MSVLRARVKGGHIVVDEPTDLPDGTELTLLLLEAEDEMTAEERADLDAMIERGRGEIAAGKGVSPEDLLARIRAL
jgi:hypothetical protein